MKSLTLLAAAVGLVLGFSAPAPADAGQHGITYAKVKHDGDRYRAYRRGDAPRRYAYNYRGRDDRRDRDGRDYRKRSDRRDHDGRDYRKRNDKRHKYSRDYRKHDHKRPHYSNYSRGRPYGPYYNYPYRAYNYPYRAYRHAYRAPSHRRHLHGAHKRLSKHYIRNIALGYYPSVFRIEYGDGIYDVWARDHRGRTFRLGYDAFTGAFLTFFLLG